MQLKKIDISNRNFAYIKPQLRFDSYTYYLVKYEGRWKAGLISFVPSRGTNTADPVYYDFDLGSHRSQLCFTSDHIVSSRYEEIYEIIDPVMRKQHAKELLK